MTPDLRTRAEQLVQAVEDKFFVAGQMDAQGHAAEKWKVGSGGTVLALSKRLLNEAREELRAALAAAEQREQALRGVLDAIRADASAYQWHKVIDRAYQQSRPG